MDPHAADSSDARRRSRLWISLLFLAMAIAVAVLIYLLPRRRSAADVHAAKDMIANTAQDMRSLRHMAAASFLATTWGKAMPLARDGRVDIYAMLKALDNPRDELVRVCFSARASKGPSRAEFEAGDYTNFPYQRRRGATDPVTLAATDPVALQGALLVWELAPRDGQRLVALSNGVVQTWDEERMQRFFRDNPGQE